MARVLVTGANGFVGSNLVEMLQARGDRVTCLVRPSARLERLRSLGASLDTFKGLADLDAIRRSVSGQDVVYHVAGATKALSRRRLYEINEQGARHVAQACAEQPNPPILVHVSSVAACGPSAVDRPGRESDPPSPVSDYGRSKLAGEVAVRELADRVPTTVVRPSIVLGPADAEGLAMYRCVKRFDVHVTPGGGGARFSMIYVGDLCRLLMLAAERGRRISPHAIDDERGVGCYFGVNEEAPTWAELGRTIGRALGRRWVLVVPVPRLCVWPVAAVVEAASRVIRRPLYLNWDKAREITAGSWAFSPEAARTELGFSCETSLADGVRQTVAWYRQAGWL